MQINNGKDEEINKTFSSKLFSKICEKGFCECRLTMCTPKLKISGKSLSTCDNCGKFYRSSKAFQTHTILCKISDKSCSLCPAKFQTEHELRVHVSLHYEGKIKCRHEGCGEIFPCHQERTEHEKMCDFAAGMEDDYPFACSYENCYKSFPKQTLLDLHRDTCPKAPPSTSFVCKVCNATLKYASTLKKHMAKHAPPQHECKICGRRFLHRYRVMEHMQTHERQKNLMEALDVSNGEQFFESRGSSPESQMMVGSRSDCKPPELVWFNDEPSEERKVELNPLETTFVKVEPMFEEEEEDDTEQDLLDSQYIKDEPVEMESVEPQDEECDYDHQDPAIDMLATTLEEEPSKDGLFYCPTCGAILKTRKILKRHMSRVHGAPYLSKRQLASQKKGGPVETFPCQVCSATFQSRKTLQYHLNIHNDVRPFPCRNVGCDEAFCSPQQRLTHEDPCKRGTIVTCSLCESKFPNHKRLEQHQQLVHNDDATEWIVSGAKEKQITAAEDSDEGRPVKRYPCRLCSMAFTVKKLYMYHMNAHNGVTPFRCRNEGCTKEFFSPQLRYSHEGPCRNALRAKRTGDS